MRILPFCLLCASLLLTCQREVGPVPIELPASSEADRRSQAVVLLERGQDLHALENRVGPQSPPARTHPDVQRALLQMERRYPKPEHWHILNAFLREKLDSLAANWERERSYTLDIQGICYEMIDHYLLPLPMDGEISRAMEYYMDELLQHRGIDLEVMTRATLALQGHVGSRKWKRYRKYIVRQAKRDLPVYRSLVEDARADYQSAGDPSSRLWKKAVLNQYADSYASAQFALQALEEGG